MYFTSKKDSIYVVVIWSSTLLLFFVTFQSEFNVVTVLIMGPILALLLWIWFGTGYTINSETLKIRSGPFWQTIHIKEITAISEEKSVWSAPALAADRLGIQYGLYKGVLISPKNKEVFIRELLKRNEKIEVEDGLFTSFSNGEEY